MALRKRLKRNLLVYRPVNAFRCRKQNRSIRKEQFEYETRAKAMGVQIGVEPPGVVFGRLQERLERRGIVWPPVPEGRPLHILYASQPGNWERHNIPPELGKIGDVSCFFLKDQDIPLDTGWEAARSAVDRLLPEFVGRLHAEHPIDMMVSYLSGSHMSAAAIETIGSMGIPTFSFHLDDRRWFRGFRCGDQWSGPATVCRAYDLNLTNATASLVKYRVEDANVLFWPEGANPDFYQPLERDFVYDVSFCGACYGIRPLLVDYLRKAGIRVACFGQDWEHGYQASESFVEVYSRTRVNLGFGYVNESLDQCLKGRDFEVPSCGAVYLTSDNADLHKVYRVGEEMETYTDFADCARKIRDLLAHPERCERMRAAARAAVLSRHTWEQRFRSLLACTVTPQA
jgi:spore maturation protein CgeB